MARTSSTLTIQPCHLLRIPPELRLIIFRLVFGDKAISMLIASKGYIESKSDSKKKAWKAILTCKKLYFELEPLLWDCTTFEISFNRDSESTTAIMPTWRTITYTRALSVLNRAEKVKISASYLDSRVRQYTGAAIVHPQLGQLFRHLNAGKALRKLNLDLRIDHDWKASDAKVDRFLDAFKGKSAFDGEVEIKVTIQKSRKTKRYGGESFNDLLEKFDL